MKKTTSVFFIAGLLFSLVMILATGLYFNSQVDYQFHHSRSKLIRDIQEQSANLTRNVLLVEKGRVNHYDDVATTQDKIDDLIDALPRDNPLVLDLIETWFLLKYNVEKIKSAYAVFQNSILYFPKGTESLYQKFAGSKQKNFITELVILERRVMQLSTGHINETDDRLRERIKTFQQSANTLPEQAKFEAIMLSKHADILLNHYVLLQELQNQLLSFKVPVLTGKILNQYNQSFEKQVVYASDIKKAFYVVCILLIIIVMISLLKLKNLVTDLQDNEQLFHYIADNAPVMLWMSDKNGQLVFTNEQWGKTGISCIGDSIFSTHSDLIYAEDKVLLENHYRQQVKKNDVTRIQYRLKNDLVECLYQDAYLVARTSKEGEFQGLICSTVDITEKKLLEQEIQLAALVFEYSLEGILISDANNRIVQVNKTFTELTGYTENEVLGKTPNLLSSGMQDKSFYQEMWQELKEQGLWKGEVYNRRKDGDVYPEVLTIITVRNEVEQITHYIAIFTDITEKKAAEENINFLAHYDALTHLPNRTFFNQRVEHAIHHAYRDDCCVAIFFLDLDRFKPINDSLGHDAGDNLLIQVAEDIKHCIREVDTVARIGGDEFTIVLEGLDKRDVYKDCPIVAEKIIKYLSREYEVRDTHVFIGVSIGISIFPDDGQTIDLLMQHADMAMYHAKEKGRNNFQFYSKQLNDVVQKRSQLEADLRKALKNQQLFINYQPQYNLSTMQIEGFEALIRWQHPQKGLMPPDEFITIAEESGLILEIGKWVLETACDQLILWQAKSSFPLRMAINVSVKQLEREGFVETVKAVLEQTGLAPETLELEVTESIFLEEGSITQQLLNQLDELGVQLSMDDFGTGYSNMSYLKKLPIDRIKIDRCFVSDIPHNASDVAIVCAIIDIARNFNIKVIAEGIEYQEQADYLLTKGCNEGQGFLFNKPLSIKDAEQLLS